MAVDSIVYTNEIKNDTAIVMNDGERSEAADITPQ